MRFGGARRMALGMLFLAGAAPAAQVEPDGRRSAVFDTAHAAGFGDPRPALRRYLARNYPRARAAQHVCVVGYGKPGERLAQVHWREGRRLILWEGSDPDAPPGDLLGWGRRDLDLARDVVASEGQVDGSTYRVTRAWVDRVIADCAARGTRYVVAAAPRRRR